MGPTLPLKKKVASAGRLTSSLGIVGVGSAGRVEVAVLGVVVQERGRLLPELLLRLRIRPPADAVRAVGPGGNAGNGRPMVKAIEPVTAGARGRLGILRILLLLLP